MTIWTWGTYDADGNEVAAESAQGVAGGPLTFESRFDAESWVGEYYPELIAEGVHQVRLHRDGEPCADAMSLLPDA